MVTRTGKSVLISLFCTRILATALHSSVVISRIWVMYCMTAKALVEVLP